MCTCEKKLKENHRNNERLACGVVCVVWCCVVVRKYRNCKKQWENMSKTRGSRFGTIWSNHGRKKKVRKRPSLPTHLFLHFAWGFTDVFRHGVQFQTPKKALFHRRSLSKGPSRAFGTGPNQRNTLYILANLLHPSAHSAGPPVGRQFEKRHMLRTAAGRRLRFPWTSAFLERLDRAEKLMAQLVHLESLATALVLLRFFLLWCRPSREEYSASETLCYSQQRLSWRPAAAQKPFAIASYYTTHDPDVAAASTIHRDAQHDTQPEPLLRTLQRHTHAARPHEGTGSPSNSTSSWEREPG